jgi:predicted transposase YbfD/YdcC
LAVRPRRALPDHRQGHPADPAAGAGHPALGPGRTESRSIKLLDLDAHPVQALFPRAARAIEVVRSLRRTATAQRSSETVFAVTSLNYQAADPGLLAAWIRRHWMIERPSITSAMSPRVKTTRRIRCGSGPHVMAALRNTALNLARLTEHVNITRAQQQADWTPRHGRRTLGAA